MRRLTLGMIAGAALLALGMAAPASAAPLGAATAAAVQPAATNGIEKVHYRRYRHCHYRYGKRWCHGGKRYYNGYYSPGVNIYIGPKYKHRKYRKYRKYRRY